MTGPVGAGLGDFDQRRREVKLRFIFLYFKRLHVSKQHMCKTHTQVKGGDPEGAAANLQPFPPITLTEEGGPAYEASSQHVAGQPFMREKGGAHGGGRRLAGGRRLSDIQVRQSGVYGFEMGISQGLDHAIRSVQTGLHRSLLGTDRITSTDALAEVLTTAYVHG